MPPTRDLVLRRRRLREAALGEPPSEPPDPGSLPLRCVEGTVIDASPHLLILATRDGSEVRLPISASAFVWHAGPAGVEAIRPGRDVVVRAAESGGMTAERIWVDIARVTGVIADFSGQVIEVDAGRHRGRTTLVISKKSMTCIRVRHPQLDAGSLIDVIGVRRGAEVHGLRPATNSPQPDSHAGHPPPERRRSGVPHVLRGTATWYDGSRSEPGEHGESDKNDRGDRGGRYGVAYPAVDPYGDAGGCGTGPASPLPLLSIASELHVRNDCTGRATRLPVIECGCVAARFRDRCVRCGTSPRRRIVELTRTAFVGLGGDLDAGCFNVTARVGI